MKRLKKVAAGQTTSSPPLLEEGYSNKIKANSDVRSWRFYRSSTRLPDSGRVALAALWGGFRLSIGWYPRLERFLVG